MGARHARDNIGAEAVSTKDKIPDEVKVPSTSQLDVNPESTRNGIVEGINVGATEKKRKRVEESTARRKP